VSENEALMKIFGSKRGETIKRYDRVHNCDVHLIL
jgi:hypothetical protein